MFFKLSGKLTLATPQLVSVRCPACRQHGTFDRIADLHDVFASDTFCTFGQRRCPNDQCHAHVFVVIRAGKLAASYPTETLDFDSAGIPVAVTQALEEAIKCHAVACFTAAAIMVRKTLEELCHERGATGTNLYERIKALSTKVVMPQELLEGMQHLRLLGNDAAHIESQNYNQVGKEEVEVGIMFAKEVLKAVYQYSSLVGRLKALQKSP